MNEKEKNKTTETRENGIIGSRKRLNVLVSVYACNPNLGSEPGMGFQWVKHLAQHCNLWVLTEKDRSLPAVLTYLDSHPELRPFVNVIGIPRQRYGETIWSHLYYWTYMLWQREAYRVASELCDRQMFDLVHQLNMIGYREPGFLWKLPLPFVWGPIGGHVQTPWRFLVLFGIKDGLRYGMRNVLNWIQMRVDKRVRRAMKSASILIAATPEDCRQIQAIHGRQAELISETGVVPQSHPHKMPFLRGERSLKLVWSGRFLAGKALPLALYALATVVKKYNNVSIEFHAIGSGPCERRWKKLAAGLGINGICHWHGTQTHCKTLEVMSTCDVLIFTSVQDATSTVVLEALQYGLPVICHDACGFGAVIDETCGIKIPLRSPQNSSQDFAKAILKFAENPNLLATMSLGALRKADQLAWHRKAETVVNLYRRALHNRKVD